MTQQVSNNGEKPIKNDLEKSVDTFTEELVY
jgi:hypothetical protein